MILITSGHEKSISHEIFLKSLAFFSPQEVAHFKIFTDLNLLRKKAQELKIELDQKANKLIVGTKIFQFEDSLSTQTPLTTSSLEMALKQHQDGDVLVTLPSSKDQIIFNGKKCTGYTDYLRKYSGNDVIMSFFTPELKVLLLTEHLPLSQVPGVISKNLITNKVSIYLREMKKIAPINKVVFAGINPHIGEAGLYGSEDEISKEAIIELKQTFPKLEFIGPIPGDAVLTSPLQKDSLYVFTYHDQGLIPFKMKSGLQGINISLGLPFLRMSVDHGTGLDLKTGEANPLGLVEVLKFALKQ